MSNVEVYTIDGVKYALVDGRFQRIVEMHSVYPTTAPDPKPPAKAKPKKAAAKKPEYVTQVVYDTLKGTLEAAGVSGQDLTDALAGYAVHVRVARKPVPTMRADADGGRCPYFGVPQHWIKLGQDSSNEYVEHGQCGMDRDGHFAKKKGYDYHLEIVRLSGRTLPAPGGK